MSYVCYVYSVCRVKGLPVYGLMCLGSFILPKIHQNLILELENVNCISHRIISFMPMLSMKFVTNANK